MSNKIMSDGRRLLIEHDGYILKSEQKRFLNNLNESISAKDYSLLETPVVYAVMQKYGIKNKNGRYYPKEILEREAENYREMIKFGTSVGETDHPESSIITIGNVSMRVIDLWWEGATLMGKIHLPITRGFVEMGVISHPADKLVHDMMNGIQYGVSTRGVGSVKNIDGKTVVQDDFELLCWDFVSNPSTIGAWVFSDKEETSPYVEEKSELKSEVKKNKVSQNTTNKTNPKIDRVLKNYLRVK